jgi:hypothetical protein
MAGRGDLASQEAVTEIQLARERFDSPDEVRECGGAVELRLAILAA